MNKTDLIDQLAERLGGDRKSAQVAVEGFIDLVQREVQKGRNVSISGFGVFEKRARAARKARNPRTGEPVRVRKTNVPVFRPGSYFKDVVAGTVKLPRPSLTPMTARAAAAAARAAAAGRAAEAKTTTTRAAAPTTARSRGGAAEPAAAASRTRSRGAKSTTPAAETSSAVTPTSGTTPARRARAKTTALAAG